MSSVARLALIVACVVSVCLFSVACAVSTYRLSPAHDGHPDFQGVWKIDWLTPLERPPEAKALGLSANEMPVVAKAIRDRRDTAVPLEYFPLDFREFMVVNGQVRSSLIVDPADGRLPYTPQARARMSQPPPLPGTDGPEQRPPPERCLWSVGLAPNLPGLPNFQTIVQTPDKIVLHNELFSQLRIVSLDDRNAPIGLPYGVMSARWEGKALVVETTGSQVPMRGGLGGVFAVAPRTRITERFLRSGPDEIFYSFIVEDPQLYTTPWRAEMVMQRSEEPVFESACHEGNYGLVNILKGARVAEKSTGISTMQKALQ